MVAQDRKQVAGVPRFEQKPVHPQGRKVVPSFHAAMPDQRHVRSLTSDSGDKRSNVGSPHVVIENGRLDIQMPGQKSKGFIVSASNMTPTTPALHPQRDDPAIGFIVVDDQQAPMQDQRITRRSIGDSR
jgi:hypothetical protein